MEIKTEHEVKVYKEIYNYQCTCGENVMFVSEVNIPDSERNEQEIKYDIQWHEVYTPLGFTKYNLKNVHTRQLHICLKCKSKYKLETVYPFEKIIYK